MTLFRSNIFLLLLQLYVALLLFDGHDDKVEVVDYDDDDYYGLQYHSFHFFFIFVLLNKFNVIKWLL